MRDAALQAAGPHDQTHERAEDRALRVGSSGRWSMRPPTEAAYFLLPILRVTRVMRSINSANQPSCSREPSSRFSSSSSSSSLKIWRRRLTGAFSGYGILWSQTSEAALLEWAFLFF